MFMNETELETLRGLIDPLNTETVRAAYRAGDFPRADKVKDLDKRYRWDLLHATGSPGYDVVKGVYDRGGHDSHVDTALRAIVKPLKDR